MADYRVYKIGPGGRIDGPSVIVQCDNDEAAIAKAREYTIWGQALEIWNGARHVATLPASTQDSDQAS